MSDKRPNILMIMADQLAAPALPFYGHPLVKTPCLSQLAEESVLFENTYCNSPLCAPSRFSMLSGQLISKIGAYDNAALYPADVPTVAHYLRASGYQTCLSGKMHFVGPDQLHGFEERLTTDIYPSDFGWTPDWEHFTERPSWYHNLLSVVHAGRCEATNQLDYDEEVAYLSNRKIYDLARSSDERPFFLLVSFTHPHDPYAITPQYWNIYRHDEIDLPAVPPIPYEQMDPHSQRIHYVCGLGEYALTEERVRNARHAYYGMISYIDDKVSELLRTLEATGRNQNTIVIFLSDHGDMLGERGLFYKMSYFEWSTRVALLFHAPERFAPRRVCQPVSLIDLLPTLVDLAGARRFPDPEPTDGQSLIPALQAGDLPVRPVYGELLCETAIAPVLMIRDERYKYIYSQPDPEQLFDLETDPHELINLASFPEYQAIREDFYRQVMKQWNPDELSRQVIASQRRRLAVYAALRQGRFTPWDFQPARDASMRYMRNHLDLNVLEKTSRYPSPDWPEPDAGR